MERILLICFLVFFTVSANANNLEDCGNLENDAERLACFDEVLKSEGTRDPSTPIPSNWTVREELSPIDDSRSVFLKTNSLEPIFNEYGTEQSVFIVLRCMENTTTMYVSFDSTRIFDVDGETAVTLRIDKEPAFNALMAVSTNNTSAGYWHGSKAIPLIKSLYGHERLLTRVTDYKGRNYTAIFNISGIKEAVVGIREACSW